MLSTVPGGSGRGGVRVLVGPTPDVVVERAEPAQLLGLDVVRLQVRAVERPAGVADARPDREVDRVEGPSGPAVVTGPEPVPARPPERPHPRLVQPVDGMAVALTSVQPLRAAFRIPAATLQQPDLGVLADQLAGDGDPRRTSPDDADVHLDLLVVVQLPHVRQHLWCSSLVSATIGPDASVRPLILTLDADRRVGLLRRG